MMQTHLQRKNLEEFLHDLICGARNSQEVGILVEVLMAMQVPEPGGESDHNQECPRLSRSSVKKGGVMNCSHEVHDTYDIFKKLPDEGTVWVGAVKGQQRARQVLYSLKLRSGQAFFAWNASEGTVVELLVN